MTTGAFRVSPLVEAFLMTATSRKDAVKTIHAFYLDENDERLPDDVAVAMVEAYYAQCADGKPWLRRKTVDVALPNGEAAS